mgnify:CR=1 FL=1
MIRGDSQFFPLTRKDLFTLIEIYVGALHFLSFTPSRSFLFDHILAPMEGSSLFLDTPALELATQECTFLVFYVSCTKLFVYVCLCNLIVKVKTTWKPWYLH